MKIHFTIPGEPKGKGRPRMTKAGIAYTPKETASYENWVKCCFMQGKQQKIEGDTPLMTCITAYFSIPKSASKKMRQHMEVHNILPIKKPDSDNIIKIILDSLNGLAYDDDKQIAQVWFRKYYGDPRVEVEIDAVELPQMAK